MSLQEFLWRFWRAGKELNGWSSWGACKELEKKHRGALIIAHKEDCGDPCRARKERLGCLNELGGAYINCREFKSNCRELKKKTMGTLQNLGEACRWVKACKDTCRKLQSSLLKRRSSARAGKELAKITWSSLRAFRGLVRSCLELLLVSEMWIPERKFWY